MKEKDIQTKQGEESKNLQIMHKEWDLMVGGGEKKNSWKGKIVVVH